MKFVLRHPWTLALGARALGAYLRVSLGSTQWTLHGREALGAYLLGGPAIFAFWHERLPMMPALWTLARRERRGRRSARMVVLVSRHQDGRLIGDIMGSFGVDLIHGSTAHKGVQRGGAASLRGLLAALRDGAQVVVTPDGPRGPPRRAARGVVQLAALADVPIIPCAAQSSRRRVLGTWDRMQLPLPFGRGVLVCGPPIIVPRSGWEARLGEVEAALTAAAEEADGLCRV
jgi:lysophospholipid acyltransferase (LPLAT)-like uncharacterized protein